MQCKSRESLDKNHINGCQPREVGGDGNNATRFSSSTFVTLVAVFVETVGGQDAASASVWQGLPWLELDI